MDFLMQVYCCCQDMNNMSDFCKIEACYLDCIASRENCELKLCSVSLSHSQKDFVIQTICFWLTNMYRHNSMKDEYIYAPWESILFDIHVHFLPYNNSCFSKKGLISLFGSKGFTKQVGRIVDSEQLLLVKLKCLCAIQIDRKYFRKEMQNSMCGGGFSKLLLAVADVTFAVFG